MPIYEKVYIVVFAKKSFPKNLEYKDIFIFSTNSWSRVFYIWDAVIISWQIIKEKKITDITCQDPFETGLVGYILKKFFNIKLELQIHTDLGSPYFFKHNLLNKIRFMTAKFILPSADKVRVVSNRIYDYIKNFVLLDKIYIRPIEVGKDKIINHQITIDLHQKYPQFKKIILMVSRLESEKNIELALQSLALIKDKDVGLVLVGDGRLRNKLQIMAEKLKLPVVFAGWVDNPIDYYKTADLFLHTAWYEGYGMVLEEAKRFGLPIISTDVGVAPDLGVQMVDFNADEIVNKIKTIFQI